MSDLLGYVGIGLSVAFTPANIFYCALGVTLGTLVGVLPGIGALATISMLYPLTFHMEPVGALVMIAGIYYGGAYGGSTASILLNLPGAASSAVTCLDGYPMSKQGRAGAALFTSAIASFIAGSIGILIMMLFSPVIVEFALQFGPAEYFSLITMGMIAASVISDGSPVKSLAMVILGIIGGLVGLDIYTGSSRFAFGTPELMEGISLGVVAMGLFGLTEVISSVGEKQPPVANKSIRLRSMLPTREEWRLAWPAALRGTAVGSFFGILPGAGATVAAFMSYAVEKRIAKDPSRFGKGAIEGVASPEAANNACDQTAFIPTMTLGIPGSATMALLIGVLMIHNITPGPTMMVERPEVFWGLVMSFWLGNILLVILNLPMIGIWVRVLTIPYHLLYPAILMFVAIGVFSINNSVFDLFAVAALGAFGYGMRLLGFPPAPFLLGFVLGPMMEEHFRRAMILSHGSFEVFVTRPISLVFLVVGLLLLLWTLWGAFRSVRASPAAAE
ncbi:tripartite tricarboxylate transporter permease [Faunimonas sp. B44]|uniref:tripartite tricarboxylate transporter permease n=1 Tax=Faunimonas sp. B44 TaxID=3461493 RepID=UPI004044A1A1